MKTHQGTSRAHILTVLVGVAGVLAWGVAPALAASAPTTLVIPISGTVDGRPESIALTGRALIRSTLVTDPNFGGPAGVILSVNLVGVPGVGLSTGTRYVATAENVLTRPFGPTDTIEVTFPLNAVGAPAIASSRSGLATFILTFDPNSGQLKGATGSLGTPSFPG